MPISIFASATLDKAKDTVFSHIWLQDELQQNKIQEIKLGFAQIIFKDRDPQLGFGEGIFGGGAFSNDNTFTRTFFDNTYADRDGKISITFNHPFKIFELEFHVYIELLNTLTIDETFQVLSEAEHAIHKIQFEDQPFQPNPLTNRKRPSLAEASISLPVPTPEQFLEESKELIRSVPEITIRSLILDFTLQTPALKGSCNLNYSGGGNRLLPFKFIGLREGDNLSLDKVTNDQKAKFSANKDQVSFDKNPSLRPVLFAQVKDQSPYMENAKVFVESTATNLLPNSFFLSSTVKQPDQYEFIAGQSVLSFNVSKSATDLAQTWDVTVQDTSFGNEEVYFQTTNATIIDPLRPLTLSVLLNILALTKDSILSKIKILFYFRDVNDIVLGTKVIEIDPTPFISQSPRLLQKTQFEVLKTLAASVHPSDFPLNTDRVFWQIGFSEVNKADGFIFQFLMPQLEQTKSPTSRVAPQTTRLADTLTVDQLDCLTLASGELAISFIAPYDQPLYDTYFFDTRHPITLLNGFAAWHEASTNLIKFAIANSTINQVIQTDGPVTFISGSRIDFRVKWLDSVREIWIGEEDLLIRDVTLYTPPLSLNDKIMLGTDSSKTPTAYLNAELKEFRVSKFILSQFAPV